METVMNVVMVYGPMAFAVLYGLEKVAQVVVKFTKSTKDDEILAKITDVQTKALDVLGLKVDEQGNVTKKA